MGQPQQRSAMGQPQERGQELMGRFFPTQNYLPEQVRRASIRLLNQTLVDTTVLVTHAKAAHWNVKGPNFFSLHELFEEIYEDLTEHVDEIAERVTTLGGEAKGTTRIAAANSRIPALPEGPVTGQEYVQLLAERLAILDSHLGEGIRMASQQDDLDTADLLNEVSREITKDLWFLEAHLQTQPIPPSGGQQMQSPGGQSQQQPGQQYQQPQGQQPQGQQPGGQQPGGQPGGQQQFGGQQQPQGIGQPQQMGGQSKQIGGQPQGSMGQMHGQMGQQPPGQQPPSQ